MTIKASYNSSDPNDPDENEPLVVNAGECSFQTFGTRSCSITFSEAGSFGITASIQGGDGDESVGVVVVPSAEPCLIPSGGFAACTGYVAQIDDGQDNSTDTCPKVQGVSGDPVFPGTGNVFESEDDYVSGGTLRITRTYNSNTGWILNYLARIINFSQNGVAVVLRPNGRYYFFTVNSSGGWTTNPNTNLQLTQLPAGDPSGASWSLRTHEDSYELFDVNGYPISVRYLGGATVRFNYQNYLLASVVDDWNHTITFAHDAQSRLSSFTTPGGATTRYSYDANDHLVGVTYPDGSVKQYRYENTQYPYALTGVIDENGVRTATWTYDRFQRATSVSGADGTNAFQFNYQTDDRQVQVTDPLGTARNFVYQNAYGRQLLTASNQPCSSFGESLAGATVGANGQVVQQTDFAGNTVGYQYDYTRNLPTTITRNGPTATAAIATNIQWDPNFRLPNRIQTGPRLEKRGYDGNGNLIQRTLVDTATNIGRTWTYRFTVNGIPISATDPDGTTTTFSNVPNGFSTALPCWITKATQPYGLTAYFNYNADCRLISMQDFNGLETDYAYDSRGRLTSKTVNPGGSQERTSYSYDSAGNLSGVALPNGDSVSLNYDSAHRLVGMTDAFGDRWAYMLDAMGNRVSERLYDPNNVLSYSHQQVFNALNRIVSDSGAQNQTTTFSYDADNRLASVTDPFRRTKQYQYDAFGRLSAVIGPDNRATTMAYDVLGQLLSVTDPRGSTTSYQYDGLGNLIQEASPDRGTTTWTYDPMGLRTGRIDAKGQATRYGYDALHRSATVSYADGTTVTYDYDAGTYGLGRLTRIADGSGFNLFSYDAFGRLAAHERGSSLLGASLGGDTITDYQYAPGGQITRITYPSGTVIDYSYDRSRLSQVAIHGGKTLMSAITYNAFGQMTNWALLGGDPASRSYDLDDRLTATELNGYQYDIANRIARLSTGSGKSATSYTVAYDLLDRITQFGSQMFSYDANGNRLSAFDGTTTTSYTIASLGDQLTSYQTGSNPSQAVSYDANGSVLGQGSSRYSYDANGRLFSGGTLRGNYYNGLDQRQVKSALVAGKRGKLTTLNTLYQYDPAGHLTGQYGSDASVQEIVWAGELPIAVLQGSTAYSIHSDHLNTPRRIGGNKVQWQLGYDAFGQTLPTGSLSFNLRYPGQYYDAETGLHQNGYRDYDPGTGRYLESDPIGLAGGLNPYAYAGGNPVNHRDPTGLYATPWHGLISFMALTMSGMNPFDAMYASGADMDSDFNWFAPGTQSPENSNWHSMAKPSQSAECARVDAQSFIQAQIATGNIEGLGRALHASEDSFARGHAYSEWDGHLTFNHLVSDWLPTYSELRDAVSTDLDIIHQFQNGANR